mmetsp:Transcript_5997/g.6704  ORF Transcript_5997/g.6704 Transcript_5997/m.6704 type:complete len:341 (-) Transcript_5997:77-1099(-)
MNVFKKLVVVNRRHRSSSVVSDDHTIEDSFCYYQHDDNNDTGNIVNDDSSSSLSFSLPLYGRRSSPPPPVVVTSTKFDSDEVFAISARAMVYRYEHENMTEQEAIDATLCKTDDKRAFIEAMDLKFTALVNDNYTSSEDDDTVSEIIIQTRSIFDSTLKSMWREIISGMKCDESLNINDAMVEQRDDAVSSLEQYVAHPKTPKNLRISPIQTVYNCKKQGIDMPYSGSSNMGTNILQPLKRQRRWFFAETGKNSPATPPSFNGNNKKGGGKISVNPFVVKKSLPKFHFDFGGSNSCKSKFFLMGGRESQPVQSLQLDGHSLIGGKRSYMPPTSPIDRNAQ